MISNTGFWTFDGPKFEHEHVYDPVLSNSLVQLVNKLNIKKSYDFGCGPGKYVQHFRNAGVETYGFDGNPVTSQIEYCSVQDLTDSNFLLKPVDFLLCLEVCEHVPKELEDTLLQTIDRHVNPSGTLVLSWAVVGQGGLGHVNCQNNDYVIEKFERMGYSYNKTESDTLRRNSRAPWFKNTILVFNKNA